MLQVASPLASVKTDPMSALAPVAHRADGDVAGSAPFKIRTETFGTAKPKASTWTFTFTLPPPMERGRSMSKRSRIPIRALWTVASVWPSRSTYILSRTDSFFSWMVATSLPSRSLRMNVSRTRSALPSTL